MPSDPVLALASLLIAYAASYTALDLWSVQGSLRLRQWLWIPAVTILSVGILGVHFGIMLALSSVGVRIEPVPLILGVALAITAASAALAAASRKGFLPVLGGGIALAVATVLLHVAHHLYGPATLGAPWRFLLWTAVACLVAVCGLYVTRAVLGWRRLAVTVRVALGALALSSVVVGSALVEVAVMPLEAPLGAHALPAADAHLLQAGGFLVVVLLIAAVLAERLQVRSISRTLYAFGRHALDLVLVVASSGEILQTSGSAEWILGYAPDELVGRQVTQVMVEEDAQALKARAVLPQEGQSLPFRYTAVLRHRNGSWRSFEGVGIDQSRDPDVGGILLNLIDVTEQRTAEVALRRLGRQRELILEHAGEGIVGTGPDGRITFTNREALRMIDLSEEEVLGRDFTDVFWIAHPDGTLYVSEENPVAQVLRDGGVLRRTDCILRGMHGLRVPIDYTVSAKADEENGTAGVVVLFVDVSHRVRYEQEKQRVAERFLAMLDQVGDAVVMEDLDGRVTYVNRVGREVLGIEVGHERDDVRATYGSLQLTDGFGRALRPEDHVVQRVKRTGISEGKVERTVQLRSGERRFLLLDAGPVFDAGGGIEGAIFTLHDVTERKRTEEELLRARRIEAVGVLAGGIAHDFNNILTVMLGNLSLAREELREHRPAAELLEQVETACRQATRLTRQLLTFSKGGAPVTQPLALAGLVEESVQFLLRGSNIRARFELPPGTWPVEADEGQLSQVLQNLVINAKQAMDQGGTLTVRAKNRRIAARSGLPLKPGDYVCITVRDEGIGIPPEVADRIFDPYFSTKPTGQGLGLATSWSIVRRHGGHIAVDVPHGGGAQFDVYLPRSLRAARPPEAKAAAAAAPSSILMMDDDAGVLAVAVRMLQGLGHQVEGVTDGQAVLHRCREALVTGTPYDVAILDLTVSGGMGGAEAALQLRAIDPGIRLIASSGYSNDAILADHAAHGFDGVLAKPYRIRDMERAVEEVLRRPRPVAEGAGGRH